MCKLVLDRKGHCESTQETVKRNMKRTGRSVLRATGGRQVLQYLGTYNLMATGQQPVWKKQNKTNNNNNNNNKKYVLSNSESVQCSHVTFKICCCVQNFIKIAWFFTEIWRYIDFEIAAVRHLGIFLPPYETTHQVSVAGRSCLSNFMSIWYTDLNIQLFEFFAYLAWSAYSGLQNGGFGGLWTSKCDYSSSRPQKAHSCVNPRLLSYQL